MKIGKYTLLDLVATGGMAELWLARQEGPAGFSRTVALKRVLPHLATDERFVQMFLDEARLAALLTHPNIVQIHDFGEAEGEYYLTMEFVRGRSFDAVIDVEAERDQHMPLETAAWIVAQACVGLEYAHTYRHPETGQALRLVHRDISPQNLMVSFDGLVKVMDFGIAKAATSTVKTQTGAVKGKYAYMSPEQIAGQPLDARSDVFALGIVLYEAVSGRRPFGKESDLVAITAILNEPPKPIREIIPDFPVELERVLDRALCKDRTDRYVDAHAMQVDLERFIRSRGAVVGSRDVADMMRQVFGAEADAPLRTGAAPAAKSANIATDSTVMADDVGTVVPAAVSTTYDALPATTPGQALPAEEEGQQPAPDAARGAPAPTTAPAPTAAGAPGPPPRPEPTRAATPSPMPQLPAVPAAPATPPEPAPEKGGGGALIFVVVALLLVVLGGGGAVAWLLLGGAEDAPASDPGPVATPAAQANPDDALRATIEAGMLARLKEGQGLLIVKARPGTTVFLGDRPLGAAPLDAQMVPAGRHFVRALLPGGQPWEGAVSVGSKARAELRIP